MVSDTKPPSGHACSLPHRPKSTKPEIRFDGGQIVVILWASPSMARRLILSPRLARERQGEQHGEFKQPERTTAPATR